MSVGQVRDDLVKVLLLIPAAGETAMSNLVGVSLLGRAARVAHEFLREADVMGTVFVDTGCPAVAEEALKWGARRVDSGARQKEQETSPAAIALRVVESLALQGTHYDAVLWLDPTIAWRDAAASLACLHLYQAGAPSVATVRALPTGGPHIALLSDALLDSHNDTAPGQSVQLDGATFLASVEFLRRHEAFFVSGETRGILTSNSKLAMTVRSAYDLELASAIAFSKRIEPVRIGSRLIGDGAPCYVIAEAGVNHNGDPALAHRLVDIAADAGADAVKFQTFDPRLLVSSRAEMADYQVANTGKKTSQAEMLEKLVLSRALHHELAAHARERGIEFLSTPFDEGSADFLEELGVVAFKIPSGELTNHPFIAHVARKGRSMLMSTGMAEMVEIDQALQVIAANGNVGVGLFHCVTSYPAAMSDSNLRAMRSMAATFGRPTGWSDHTQGITASVAAVAMGAAIIEKHFTIDRALPGPDHAASLMPGELAELIRAVRDVEQARGDGIKAPRPAEIPLRVAARKSLHTSRAVAPGSVLTSDALVALRPGNGIPPSRLHEVIGRRVSCALAAGQMLEEAHLE